MIECGSIRHGASFAGVDVIRFENEVQGVKKKLQNHVLVILGWFFTLLGIIGAFLPVLPTTPFLIVALVLFSKSSPRFHQMLLDNEWFGPGLKQWEENKTLARKTKVKAIFLIVATFGLSVAIFKDKPPVQFILVGLAVVLIIFIWRLNEPAE